MRFLYLICTVLLLTSGLSVDAQKKTFYSKQGDRAMDLFDYKLAVDNYALAIKHKKGDTVYPIRKTADCYRLMNEPAKAKQWYGKIANMPGVDPLVKFYYAEALRQMQEYETARSYYQDYLAVSKDDRNVNDIIAGLDQVKELAKDKGIYKIELMPYNSPYSDFGPAFYGKDSIFFASNRKNKFSSKPDKWSYNDFYQLYKVPANGAVVSNIIKKKPNGRFHDGPAAYNAATYLMIFTRSNYVKSTAKTAIDNKTVNLKLFSMVYPYSKKPTLFSLPFNDKNFSNAHPSFSKDGRTLYFSSDRPGGYGGTDLYKSERNGDAWGAPINLGPQINGKYDEKFPFITEEGVLYFASDALGGLGGLDIYESKQDGGKWSAPMNLGAPINSNFDDFGLIFKDEIGKGYFTSNRKGGAGDDDIYGFTKKKITDMPITIRVVDAETQQPIDGASVDVPCASSRIKNFLSNGLGESKMYLGTSASCDAMASKDGYASNTTQVMYSAKDNTYIIPLRKKMNQIKLLVEVRERGSELAVRDFSIAIKDASGAVSNYVTNPRGAFETGIVPAAYTVTSVDAAGISDAIAATEQPDANGYIKRLYYIDPIVRRVSVPITSDCFAANSIVEVTNKSTGEVARTKVDENGTIRLALKSNSKYVVTNEGKEDVFETNDLKPGDVINMKCKFIVGQTWILNNIYYDLDKSFIRRDAAVELDKLVAVMKQNPTLVIELSSHTDCRQTATYNEQLSVRRAKAAVEYIVAHSVASSRLVAAGYGEKHLVNGCACEPTNVSPCTNEQHQMNRRTEVKVLKY
jgi:outer membrane protein OmpA-like peptidoglycan-associated protein/tetratricopeptide (TPR) repeat protein